PPAKNRGRYRKKRRCRDRAERNITCGKQYHEKDCEKPERYHPVKHKQYRECRQDSLASPEPEKGRPYVPGYACSAADQPARLAAVYVKTCKVGQDALCHIADYDEQGSF